MWLNVWVEMFVWCNNHDDDGDDCNDFIDDDDDDDDDDSVILMWTYPNSGFILYSRIMMRVFISDSVHVTNCYLDMTINAIYFVIMTVYVKTFEDWSLWLAF